MDNTSNNSKDLSELTVSEREIYTGKYISLKVLTVESKKGYFQREIIQHSGTIVVVAVTEDENIVLNKVYRKSIENYSIELPSKKIESGENYVDVIRSEMTEKLGYEILSVKNAYNFYPSISYSNEKVYMYVVDVKRIKDATKDILIMQIPLDEISKQTKELGIVDAKTIIGLDYLKTIYKR